MIKLITQHPIAIDSDDHHYPDGVHLDNHFYTPFADSVENFYNYRKICLLDLGCAGGGLVAGMTERGHIAVGLEGSDHCLNIKQEIINKLGSMPLGYQNWQNYGNKNLFTCDITYDYEIRNNDELMTFDLITCFDVMEHFHEERIDKFLEMVVKHLKPNGIFAANIAMFNLEKDKIIEEGRVEYHKSLFSKEKWLNILSKRLKEIEYPFITTNRGHPKEGNADNLVYAGVKL